MTKTRVKPIKSLCCGVPTVRDRWGATTCAECAQEVSPCCGAAVTFSDDGALCCKKCWEAVQT